MHNENILSNHKWNTQGLHGTTISPLKAHESSRWWRHQEGWGGAWGNWAKSPGSQAVPCLQESSYGKVITQAKEMKKEQDNSEGPSSSEILIDAGFLEKYISICSNFLFLFSSSFVSDLNFFHWLLWGQFCSEFFFSWLIFCTRNTFILSFCAVFRLLFNCAALLPYFHLYYLVLFFILIFPGFGHLFPTQFPLDPPCIIFFLLIIFLPFSLFFSPPRM